jgi:hypothetical protein
MKTRLLLVVLLGSTLLHAECGINKPLKIFVQKSYHKDKVVVPNSGCKTAEGPCKVSGTIFIVSTKKVKYTILLVDGTSGNLEVGESYSAFISCGKTPMMMVQNEHGQDSVGLYVIEQEAL